MNTASKKKRLIHMWWSIRKSVLKPTTVSLIFAALALALPSVAIAQLPGFNIDVVGNHIYASNWKANSVLTVTTSSGGYATKITDSTGSAVFVSLSPGIEGGDIVTVADSDTTISYMVANVIVTSVDACNNRVSGTADPGTMVRIRDFLLGQVPPMNLVTDASGQWVADFSTLGFDLQPGHRGEAIQSTNVYPVYCSTQFGWEADPCAPSVGEVVAYSGDSFINDVPIRDLGTLQLEKLDEVRTGSDGRVEAELGGTTVNIGPSSGMTVAESTTQTKTSLERIWGQMRTQVRSDFVEIITPTAVASSRGTELLFEATPNETRILMLEHDADVSTVDGSQSLVLQEFQGVIVTANGIGDPFPVSPNETERWWEQLVISVASPVNLYVTDPLGRHIGYDPAGIIVNEIPGAVYSGPDVTPEEVTIPGPVEGIYGIELIPVGTGDYHLTVAGMGLGEESFLNEYSGSVEASGESVHLVEGFESAEGMQQVEIDIKPGGFPNAVNPRSRGRLPVAVLTTDNFDVASLDWMTARFGTENLAAEPANHAMEDVDGDGDLDLILHFRTRETGIECGDTSAHLTGLTLSGVEIHGSDSVSAVGCGKW